MPKGHRLNAALKRRTTRPTECFLFAAKQKATRSAHHRTWSADRMVRTQADPGTPRSRCLWRM